GDEADGFDEIIYPCDYLRSGIISDDEMYDLMVKDLPAGVQLTALVDACHSGTMLDLPYVYNGDHVTALEKITKPRTKVGAMAAMSADESTNIPMPGSISGANVQTTTTTTTTTITTVVGPDGMTQQITNTNGVMTTSGSLLPPTGIPAIQSKEGANGLTGHSQAIRCVDETEENGNTDDANMASTAAPSVSVTENTASPSIEVTPIHVAEEKPSEALQPIVVVEEKPSEVPQITVVEKTPEVTVVQKVETEEEKEERECEELAHKMAMFRETKGNVVMFSGCRDDQASADIRASAKDAAIISSHQKLLAEANAQGTITNWSRPIDNDGHSEANAGGYSLPQTYMSPQARGAVSYAWIKSLSLKRDQTYEELLLSMRNFMKQRDLEQVPQLGSGRPMDMRATFRL
ncbi:Ca(2+)-dependent cysteine protease, partial [Mortierella sp. NVP85]